MRAKFVAVTGVLLSMPLCAALALPVTSFTQVFTFGDSLSDPGNASIVSLGAFPGPNYATRSITGVPFPVGYYTDGPSTTPASAGPTGLWIDQFTSALSLPDQPALAPLGGTNYAVASAQTGSANPQDITNQIGLFTTNHLTGAPSNALYAVWGGANDILNGKSGAAAADNLFGNIQLLSAEGAKYFVWLNVPQLGETPRGLASGSGPLNTESTAFDNEWASDIAKLQAAGIYVIGVDVNSLFNRILANPGSFGFSNTTSPGQGSAGPANSYLFWDMEHPTTAGDALVAQLAMNDLVAAPEPVSAGLALLGIFAVFAARKIRRKTVIG